VSYGTFVAERYAITHPDRVSRLVLDSIVPHDNVDPLELAGITRTTEVLRMVCREIGCTTDPAQDLSEVVRARHGGPELYDTLTSLRVGQPRLTDIPAALHDATRGDYTGLDAIVAAERQNQAAEADELSQGLHASTMCEDLHGPWGDAATPVAGRAAATVAAVAGLSDAAVFPYDRSAAAANGIAVTCEQWPSHAGCPVPGRPGPARSTSAAACWRPRPSHSVVVGSAGGARALRGHLVVIPGSGHSTQSGDNGPVGRATVTAFLIGP
jgi:pimeloyl-ACP methyl ester carboxylesterase